MFYQYSQGVWKLYFWKAYEKTTPVMYTFAYLAFVGSPAMKSSMLRCRDNLNPNLNLWLPYQGFQLL